MMAVKKRRKFYLCSVWQY